MQIKTTMKYHLTLVRMASIKKLQTINAGETVDKRKPSCTVWWDSKLIQPLWRTVWKFLEKLKVELSYDPGASLVAQTVKNLPVV